MRLALTILAISHLTLVVADILGNGIVDEPKVECGADSLNVAINTLEAFEGHVYVKEQYGKELCRSSPTLINSVNLTIDYEQCQVKKTRLAEGIEISTTIIISFHPMFQTKADRTFNVECFYAELKNNVENELKLELSDEDNSKVLRGVGDRINGSQYSNVSSILPECKYEVLTAKDGSPVTVTKLGESVYHRWSCDYSGTENFCATVHTCSVHDANMVSVLLLDENGCATDKFLLNNLEYTSDLVGGREADVFKFADQAIIYFQCSIRLTLKNNGVCERTSDNCPSPLRGKRSTDQETQSVRSQLLNILDYNDPHIVLIEKPKDMTCITTSFFFGGIFLLATLIVISTISIAMFVCRACSKTYVVKMNDLE